MVCVLGILYVHCSCVRCTVKECIACPVLDDISISIMTSLVISVGQYGLVKQEAGIIVITCTVIC